LKKPNQTKPKSKPAKRKSNERKIVTSTQLGTRNQYPKPKKKEKEKEKEKTKEKQNSHHLERQREPARAEGHQEQTIFEEEATAPKRNNNNNNSNDDGIQKETVSKSNHRSLTQPNGWLWPNLIEPNLT